jgi:regulator of extracellular matrix RemA (YlzA/DUF370 family)
MKLLNTGFGNLVAAGRVVALVNADAAPIRRMVQTAREENRVIDATAGRKTRTVLVLDTGSLLLSALQPETLAARLEEQGTAERNGTQGGWTT